MNYEMCHTTFNPVLEGIKLIFLACTAMSPEQARRPDRRIAEVWLSQ